MKLTEKEALVLVAKDFRENAYAVRKKDRYAPHITEEQKDRFLKESLERADEIERGENLSFTVWQKVNYKLTGKCVGFLPPPPTT